MRVLFLQSNVDDAHQMKVIKLMAGAGCVVTRCGFVRDSYYRATRGRAGVRVLGTLRNRSFVSRLPLLLRSIPEVRRLSSRCDALFCFGADMQVLGMAAAYGKGLRIFREIADLPEVLIQAGCRGKLAREIERFCLGRLDGLLVTSDKFLDKYIRPLVGESLSRCFVIENKLDPGMVGDRCPAPRFSEDCVITIGYFGLLRCVRSMDVLVRIAESCPERFRVTIRGYNAIGYPLKHYCSKLRNFEYGGEYESPHELAMIYRQCDIVWSCYPYVSNGVNARLAQTNRYYESVYFRRPQICQTGTVDGSKVERYGIGVNVDLSDLSRAAGEVVALTSERLNRMVGRIEQLPLSACCYEREFSDVVRHMEGLALASGVQSARCCP